ncbi:MAG: phosphatidylglycerol lysyltransferase domain-containing protein [Litoreibacter sp.]
MTTDKQTWDRTLALRTGLPVLISAVFLWKISEKIDPINLSDLSRDLVAFSLPQWFGAILCAVVSFAAVARYDPLVVNKLRIDVPPRRAIVGGWQATALAQFLGFGIASGTLVRWWLYSRQVNGKPSITMWQAFQLCCGVTVTFFVGWAIVTSCLYLFLGLPGLVLNTSTVLVAVFIILSLSAVAWQKNKLLQQTLNPVFISRAVVLTIMDTSFASLILFIFFPEGYTPFLTLYLIFLVSFAVGMVSGLPGGVGPFEFCMIMLLPDADLTAILPALFAFRLVYFAGPAALSMALMAVQALRQPADICVQNGTGRLPPHLRQSAPPDADLLRQGMLSCVSNDMSNVAVLSMQNKRVHIVLGDPFGNALRRTEFIKDLAASADWMRKGLCFYRCNFATAHAASKLGFSVHKFSVEARIRPATFTLNIPSRASLRRKLRKVTKAKVDIITNRFQKSELAQIDQEWCQAHGGARGFSTGHFSFELIERQRLYVAQKEGIPFAFVTFSTNEGEWLLDLIRHTPNCPDGTIYALIVQALEDARCESINTVSLGNVPFAPDLDQHGFLGYLHRLIFRKSPTLRGLYQFKKTFDPEWVERFIAVSSKHHIPKILVDIHRAIHRPHSLQITKNTASSS